MARSYGRIATSIWRDKDFRDLTPEARFTYTMLIGQPNISAAGVLELTINRWAGHTGYTPTAIRGALCELVEHRYVVIDDDAEELLIRSFVRWDGGANNDLRRKAIKEAAESVSSDELRACMAYELDRVQVPHGLSKAPRSPIEAHRVVVTEGELEPQPTSATVNPDSATPGGEPSPSKGAPPQGIDDPEPSEFCSEHMPDGSDSNCGRCAGARKRHDRWIKREERRAAESTAAFRQAIKNCGLCDEHGRRLDPDTGAIVGACDHLDHRRTA